MRNRKAEIAFFVFGLSIFVYLVERFGVGNIVENIHRAGWSLLYAIGIWFVIYLLNTAAWKLILGENGRMIGFPYLFMVTVSGFILNYITPVISLGGEPYKVKKLSAAMGAKQSLSAVVSYRMIHLLGHMLLLLAGIAAALIVLRLPATVVIALLIAAVLITVIVLVTLTGQRKGVFQWFQRFLGKLTFIPKAATALDNYHAELEEMDAALTSTFHLRRGAFYASIATEFLSRALMGLEMYVILAGVGVPVTPVSAIFIFVMYSILINVMFFIPMSIGSREGGIYLGLESLALPPLMSIYFGIVMRIREFFWILVGLMFILVANGKKQENPVTAGNGG